MKLQHNRVIPPVSGTDGTPLRPFPPHVKLHKLALAQAERAGTLPLALFERLCSHPVVSESALADAPPLTLQLRFGFDAEGWLVVTGRVLGTLPVVCQRCLDVFEQTVDLSINLACVTNEQDMARLPSDYEPFLFEEESVNTVDLIEDDLLLNLLEAPMHADPACAGEVLLEASLPIAAASVRDATSEAGDFVHGASKENPFQVLEALKGSLTLTSDTSE